MSEWLIYSYPAGSDYYKQLREESILIQERGAAARGILSYYNISQLSQQYNTSINRFEQKEDCWRFRSTYDLCNP